MEKQAYPFPATAPLLYLVGMDEASRAWVFRTAIALRHAGIPTEIDYAMRSVKAQMREANRIGAPYVAVIGESEISSGQAQVKDMRQGTQESVEFGRLTEYLTMLRQRLSEGA